MSLKQFIGKQKLTINNQIGPGLKESFNSPSYKVQLSKGGSSVRQQIVFAQGAVFRWAPKLLPTVACLPLNPVCSKMEHLKTLWLW